jgi:hypothetical protein
MTPRIHRQTQHRITVLLGLLAGCLLPAAATAQTPTTFPNWPGQAMLIKNTITAVNHGNITGNYTVLRDLACESFRRRNTAVDLASAFTGLRQQKVDLSPILMTEPRLTKAPQGDGRGRMRLLGYIPTQPKAVQFDLIFQSVDGGWMIDEVTLDLTPIESLVPRQPTHAPASYVEPEVSGPSRFRRP